MQTRKRRKAFRPKTPYRININKQGFLPSPPSLPKQNPAIKLKTVTVLAKWTGTGSPPYIGPADLTSVEPYSPVEHFQLTLELPEKYWDAATLASGNSYSIQDF